MKGVAIMLMVFLHLFMVREDASECTNCCYVGDMPLVNWLTRAANPVGFFLILSGYGMHYIHSRGSKDNNRYGRLVRLYAHYIVCFGTFTIVGLLPIMGGAEYGFHNLVCNLTAWNTTMYPPGWFLFPFVGLSFLSPWIFKLTDRMGVVPVLISSFVLGTITSFFVSRYGELWLNPYQGFKNFFLIVHLAPAFIWGGMFHRVNNEVNEKLKIIKGKRYLWIIMIALIIARCVIDTGAWGAIYPMAFILIFLLAPRWSWIDHILILLGSHSMNIWFIHYWIYSVYFHQELFALKYPVLIFIVLMGICLALSYIVNAIVTMGNRVLMKQSSLV